MTDKIYRGPGASSDGHGVAEIENLAGRLAAEDAAGNLTVHEWENSCEVGVWHTGTCDEAAGSIRRVLEQQDDTDGM